MFGTPRLSELDASGVHIEKSIRGNDMNSRDSFFEEVRVAQDRLINILRCNKDKYNNVDDLVIDSTYEAIYSVLEIIDGFNTTGKKYYLTDCTSEEVLNSNSCLHNECENRLMHTNI